MLTIDRFQNYLKISLFNYYAANFDEHDMVKKVESGVTNIISRIDCDHIHEHLKKTPEESITRAFCLFSKLLPCHSELYSYTQNESPSDDKLLERIIQLKKIESIYFGIYVDDQPLKSIEDQYAFNCNKFAYVLLKAVEGKKSKFKNKARYPLEGYLKLVTLPCQFAKFFLGVRVIEPYDEFNDRLPIRNAIMLKHVEKQHAENADRLIKEEKNTPKSQNNNQKKPRRRKRKKRSTPPGDTTVQKAIAQPLKKEDAPVLSLHAEGSYDELSAIFFDKLLNQTLKTLRLHPRVKRWQTEDEQTIREFTDGYNNPYKDKATEEIFLLRAKHHIPHIARLLTKEYIEFYAKKTDRGFYFEAIFFYPHLGLEKQGKIFIGCDAKEIFHCYFTSEEEQNELGECSIEEKEEEGGDWSVPRGCISRHNNIIEFNYGTFKYHILPLEEELLNANIGDTPRE